MLRRIAILLLIAGCCLISKSAVAEEAEQTLPALPAVEEICRAIDAVARKNELPVDFFTRLIWQESRFNARAVSRAGAKGIAQFMPKTAIWRGLANPFDAIEALHQSADYLRELRNQFGNLGLAAAAYNGGSGRVQNWLDGRGALPIETRAYIRIITGYSAEQWASPEPPDWHSDSPKGIPCPELANVLTASSTRAPSARRQTTRVASAPWGVQLLGNRSEGRALADYAQLQRKYAGVLGGRAPLVLRTRMFGRDAAIWSQVRVGSPNREDAQKLCSRLRSAGGSCLVLRNYRSFASS
jgi:Transglycosylase SLT domain/SPOR domain